MKKILILAAVATMATVFSGCTDNSTPTSTLGIAYEAVQQGNVHALRKVLMGDARAVYGSKNGLETLRAQLKGKHPTVSEPTLATEQGYWWGYKRTYNVTVADSISATVMCVAQDIQADSEEGQKQNMPDPTAIFVTACYISSIK